MTNRLWSDLSEKERAAIYRDAAKHIAKHGLFYGGLGETYNSKNPGACCIGGSIGVAARAHGVTYADSTPWDSLENEFGFSLPSWNDEKGLDSKYVHTADDAIRVLTYKANELDPPKVADSAVVSPAPYGVLTAAVKASGMSGRAVIRALRDAAGHAQDHMGPAAYGYPWLRRHHGVGPEIRFDNMRAFLSVIFPGDDAMHAWADRLAGQSAIRRQLRLWAFQLSHAGKTYAEERASRKVKANKPTFAERFPKAVITEEQYKNASELISFLGELPDNRFNWGHVVVDEDGHRLSYFGRRQNGNYGLFTVGPCDQLGCGTAACVAGWFPSTAAAKKAGIVGFFPHADCYAIGTDLRTAKEMETYEDAFCRVMGFDKQQAEAIIWGSRRHADDVLPGGNPDCDVDEMSKVPKATVIDRIRVLLNENLGLEAEEK